MSDQHVVTDWKAYFDSLGPGAPSPLSRDVAEMYAGPVACSVTYVGPRGDLEAQDMPDGAQLLEWAHEVWALNGKPEMWVFISRGGPPWRVPAQSKPRPRPGAKS